MDAREKREASLKGWDGVAPAWLDYADAMRTKMAPVAHWMLDRLGLDDVHAVLELACGAGDLSVQIAERAGANVAFVASDFSPEMVSAAKTHAQAKGITDIDFNVLDAQNISLEDASVDAIACRYGYMLMPEPDNAFAETYRVLKPGGRAVLAVWGALERNAWLMAFGLALMQTGHGTGDDPFAPGGVFSLADPGVLLSKIEGAGFSDVEIEEIAFTYDFDDFDSYWVMQSRLAGGAAKIIESLDPEQQSEIKDVSREIAANFETNGSYSFPALALGAVGRKY